MKVSELLNETNWTQFSWAKNEKGEPVDVVSKAAHFFCLVGAVAFCYPNKKEWVVAYGRLLRRLGDPFAWNDAPERKWTDIESIIKELDL